MTHEFYGCENNATCLKWKCSRSRFEDLYVDALLLLIYLEDKFLNNDNRDRRVFIVEQEILYTPFEDILNLYLCVGKTFYILNKVCRQPKMKYFFTARI